MKATGVNMTKRSNAISSRQRRRGHFMSGHLF